MYTARHPDPHEVPHVSTALHAEPLRPLSEVLTENPSTASIHVRTAGRWALKGLITRRGLVRLEHRRVGGRLFASAAALERFLSLINTDPQPGDAPRSPG